MTVTDTDSAPEHLSPSGVDDLIDLGVLTIAEPD